MTEEPAPVYPRFETKAEVQIDPRGKGLVVVASLQRYDEGALTAGRTYSTQFAYRKETSDPAIFDEVDRWFDDMAALLGGKILQESLDERARIIAKTLSGRTIQI
jgi:hypothetical protein